MIWKKRLILRFLHTYATPYWPHYLIGIAALYGTNQLTVLVPQLIKQAIDALGAGDRQTSLARIGLIAIYAVAIIVIRTTSRVCIFNPGRAAEFRLKNDLFRHLLRLPRSFYDVSRSGDLMSRATNDLQSVRALIGFAGLQILDAIFIIPLTFHQMLMLDSSLTKMTLGLLLFVVVILWYSAQKVMSLVRHSMEQLARLSDHILDTYTAIPVVQGFCAMEAFDERFSSTNELYIRSGLSISAIRSFLMPLVTLVGSISLGLVLWLGGRMVLRDELSVGALVAYSGYIGLLVHKLMAYGWMLSAIQRGMVALARIYRILDTEPALPEVHAPFPAEVLSPDRRSSGYRLEVRRLDFSYPGARDRASSLTNISFEIEPGQTVGIFGQTGSGKTTLIQLLARVYTPPPGTVFLNGVDICDIPLDAYRDIIALVPQDAFLFSRTIRENIRWSDDGDLEKNNSSGERLDDPRLQRSIRLACLEDDLRQLNQGLETMVGARGVTLSGGQRQRVALARAFFKRFRILLLDDVLAAVDHQTEQRLIRNIYTQGDEEAVGHEEAMGHEEAVGHEELSSRTPDVPAGVSFKADPPVDADLDSPVDNGHDSRADADLDSPVDAGQTTIIISHRISALMHADRILVLDEGRLLAQGRHAELLEQPGIYSETYRAQQEATNCPTNGKEDSWPDPSGAPSLSDAPLSPAQPEVRRG